MLILGEKEQSDNKVSVRKHGGEDLGSMDITSFCEHIKTSLKKEIEV